MAITNSNGNSASPENMPLWIFTFAKLFPPAVNSTLQVCMVFLINCTNWSVILYILRQKKVINPWVGRDLVTSTNFSPTPFSYSL